MTFRMINHLPFSDDSILREKPQLTDLAEAPGGQSDANAQEINQNECPFELKQHRISIECSP